MTLPAEVPVPERFTPSGVGLLLLVMVHKAVSGATVVGVNTMPREQLADAARLEPQVLEVTVKSPAFAPEMPAPLNVTANGVVFETVTTCEALDEPSFVLPKSKLAGEAATLPVDVPRPERDTCCGLFDAVSVTASVAVRVPEVVGLKSTVTVQLADAARLEPQVFW
ncbi:MAG TPA: hypothetical protein VFW25_10350 [Silvibacterium sp.]|nr:hypothetical protein [Silvibacterium sp.]